MIHALAKMKVERDEVRWVSACGKTVERDVACRDPNRVTCQARGCQARVRKWRAAIRLVSTLEVSNAPTR